MPHALCVEFSWAMLPDRAAADACYALKAVGLWRWVIGQIVRGFPQSVGHIKQPAVLR